MVLVSRDEKRDGENSQVIMDDQMEVEMKIMGPHRCEEVGTCLVYRNYDRVQGRKIASFDLVVLR
mgnify:CR=1 FL=1